MGVACFDTLGFMLTRLKRMCKPKIDRDVRAAGSWLVKGTMRSFCTDSYCAPMALGIWLSRWQEAQNRGRSLGRMGDWAGKGLSCTSTNTMPESGKTSSWH